MAKRRRLTLPKHPVCYSCGMEFRGIGAWDAGKRHAIREGHWVEQNPSLHWHHPDRKWQGGKLFTHEGHPGRGD